MSNNCFDNNAQTQLLSTVVDLNFVNEIKYFQANQTQKFFLQTEGKKKKITIITKKKSKHGRSSS